MLYYSGHYAAAVSLFGKWDWKAADEETAPAIELNPNSWEAHGLRAFDLIAIERREDALQEAKRGSELDSVSEPWMLGSSLYACTELMRRLRNCV